MCNGWKLAATTVFSYCYVEVSEVKSNIDYIVWGYLIPFYFMVWFRDQMTNWHASLLCKW